MIRTTINLLKDSLSGAKRIAVVAIGSELRGDDAAGMLVAEDLEKKIRRAGKRSNIRIFAGGTAPENLTGEIIRYKPDEIVIVDTVDMKKKPGEIALLRPQNIGKGATFSTHTMPAKVLIDYLMNSIKGCGVTFLGIQPKTLGFGKKPSSDVKRTVLEISGALSSLKSKG
jgi:hydrogenase 3 maturation protease